MGVLSAVKTVETVLRQRLDLSHPGEERLEDHQDVLISDLLTDLQHYCAQKKLPFSSLFARASRHFEQENRLDLQWADTGPGGKEVTWIKGLFQIIRDESTGTFEVRNSNGGCIATTADLSVALLIAESELKEE